MIIVHTEQDGTIDVIDDTTGQILTSFEPDESIHSLQRAELMAYLINKGCFEHQHETCGVLSVDGLCYGLVDLSEDNVYHNLWNDYEDG